MLTFWQLERCAIRGIINSGQSSNKITQFTRCCFSITAWLITDSIKLWTWIDTSVPSVRRNLGQMWMKVILSYTPIKRTSSSLPNESTPAVNLQTKQRDAGSWLCPLNKSPSPSPKNLKRWHCGAPLVCSWWPVRSVWCEWAGVQTGGLDSNMQWH